MDSVLLARGAGHNGRPRHRGRPKHIVIADKWRIGRIQLGVRRAMVAAGGKPLGIADLLARCYPRASNHPVWHRTTFIELSSALAFRSAAFLTSADDRGSMRRMPSCGD